MSVIISVVAAERLYLAWSLAGFNLISERIFISRGVIDDFGGSLHERYEFHEFYQFGGSLFLIVAFAQPKFRVHYGSSQNEGLVVIILFSFTIFGIYFRIG